MARIIGGIAASHTPTIGFAYDRNKRDDPAWAPIFENFAPLSSWLAEKRPDLRDQLARGRLTRLPLRLGLVHDHPAHRVLRQSRTAPLAVSGPWPQDRRAMLSAEDYRELSARCIELADESSEPSVAEAGRSLRIILRVPASCLPS